MTKFGVMLGIAGMLLVAFLLAAIYVLDPLGFTRASLADLYASPDSQPQYGLAFGWAAVAAAAVWGVGVWEARLARSWREGTRAQTRKRRFGAVALLGAVCVSSFIPGFPISLGFIIDAENGGFFTGSGGGVLSTIWPVGLVVGLGGLTGLVATRTVSHGSTPPAVRALCAESGRVVDSHPVKPTRSPDSAA